MQDVGNDLKYGMNRLCDFFCVHRLFVHIVCLCISFLYVHCFFVYIGARLCSLQLVFFRASSPPTLKLRIKPNNAISINIPPFIDALVHNEICPHLA